MKGFDEVIPLGWCWFSHILLDIAVRKQFCVIMHLLCIMAFLSSHLTALTQVTLCSCFALNHRDTLSQIPSALCGFNANVFVQSCLQATGVQE